MQANSTLDNAKALMLESKKRHYVFRLPALERMSQGERSDRKAAAEYILSRLGLSNIGI